MTKDFLGVGWGFPVRPGHEPGEVAFAHYEESVHDAIWLILKTSPGERVMRPTFGCGLDDVVFSVGSAKTAGDVAEAVRRALTIWEPRMELLDVAVNPDPASAGTLLIELRYLVRATNNVFNIVHPFYLDQVEG